MVKWLLSHSTKAWSNRELDDHVGASCPASLALAYVRSISSVVASQDSMMVGKPEVPSLYCGSSGSGLGSTS